MVVKSLTSCWNFITQHFGLVTDGAPTTAASAAIAALSLVVNVIVIMTPITTANVFGNIACEIVVTLVVHELIDDRLSRGDNCTSVGLKLLIVAAIHQLLIISKCSSMHLLEHLNDVSVPAVPGNAVTGFFDSFDAVVGPVAWGEGWRPLLIFVPVVFLFVIEILVVSEGL